MSELSPTLWWTSGWAGIGTDRWWKKTACSPIFTQRATSTTKGCRLKIGILAQALLTITAEAAYEEFDMRCICSCSGEWIFSRLESECHLGWRDFRTRSR